MADSSGKVRWRWRADEWLFFETRCHFAGEARALVTCKVWGRVWPQGPGAAKIYADCKRGGKKRWQHRLVATVAQEGLIRPPRK